MYNKLVFISPWHSGDAYLNRGFLEDLSLLIPAKEYSFCHNNSRRLFLDLPFLTLDSETLKWFDWRKYNTLEKNGDFYINTWAGINHKYDLPGTGTVLEKHYERYIDLGFKLSGDVYKYVPQINPLYYKQDYDTSKLEQYKKKILICNGPVWSSQATNFSFTSIVNKLSDTYKDYLFILTEKIIRSPQENVIYTDDLFGMPMNDLNEIGILSTQCNIVVGRSSGPFTFAQHKVNWEDPNKTLLSFTIAKEASHILLTDKFPVKKIWSPENKETAVYSRIANEIERL